MKNTQLVAAAGLALGLAALAAGQTATVVLKNGQPVASVGLVTFIDNVAVNNSGVWLVEADTDNTNTDTDSVLVKGGSLFLREGDPLTAPAGASIDSFDAVNINSAGNSGWNFFLAGTPGLSFDSGMFYNSTLIFQESTISTAAGLSANTPYIGFFESVMNDSNQVLIVASVDDPAIASTVDRAMVRVDYNAAAGTYTELVLAKEGEFWPELVGTLTDFGTSPQTIAIANNGDCAFVAFTGNLGGVFKANAGGRTPLALDNGNSPIVGRTYRSMTTAECDLNNNGDWVVCALINGDTATDQIIVKNGVKVIQEGDAPPGIAGGWALTAFGTQLVQIADSGDVLWFGDWNDPDTTRDTALYVNSTPILQEGVSTVGGVLVKTIASGVDAYMMSPNGRYIIVEVTLDEGGVDRNAAVLIDRGTGGGCYANCDGSTGAPVLNVNDFVCFNNRYAASDPYANCDASTIAPTLNVNDFTCFLNAYAVGCGR